MIQTIKTDTRDYRVHPRRRDNTLLILEHCAINRVPVARWQTEPLPNDEFNAWLHWYKGEDDILMLLASDRVRRIDDDE